MIGLGALRRCFEGVIPSTIATCAADGTPNVSYISHVEYVDERHVAISHQFFNKTRANLQANPHACVAVVDPVTSQDYTLRVRFDHEEASGPLFDAMALRIQAIASQAGMERVFRLIAADVLEVLEIEEHVGAADLGRIPPAAPVLPAGFPSLSGLRLLTERINRATDLAGLLDAVLESMEGVFGFAHSMILLADEDGERLVTVASRGYPRCGAGAEVRVGEGIIGTVASARRLLRLSGLDCQLRYARSVGDETAARAVPLPGLPDAVSQLAVPLLVCSDLVGVLAVESARPLPFGAEEETFLSVVAAHVAYALRHLLERAAAEDEEEAPRRRPEAPARTARARRQFLFYPSDDCVFVDGQYLIRNLPGRILWKLLQSRQREGRQEFTNRELRLDASLGLPPIKDNLESRLLLLRRRLEEKCPDVRIVPTARGRFALELGCELDLVEKV